MGAHSSETGAKLAHGKTLRHKDTRLLAKANHQTNRPLLRLTAVAKGRKRKHNASTPEKLATFNLIFKPAVLLDTFAFHLSILQIGERKLRDAKNATRQSAARGPLTDRPRATCTQLGSHLVPPV